MESTEGLGQRLQRIREAAGLTQVGLAEKTGLPVSNIRNWEQDHRTPNIFALFKIAKALGAPMEDFVAGLTEEPKNLEGKKKARKKRE